MKGNFENSWLLVKFILRKERVISAVWILVLAFCVIGLVPGMQAALDEEGRAAIFPVLEMPAMVSMVGPAYAAEYETFGALYTNFMMLFTALTAGLMNIFLIVRHTRADEEKGRYEVVRSLPVGRLANLNAAMIAAVIINIILSITVGLGMFALGDESMCFNGSMLWGASLGATGLVFAAVAALFAQLSQSSRGATGYSFAALAVIYLLRAPGDMNADLEILALISPLGLVMRTKAYMSNEWWPVIIMTATAVILSAAAYRLNFSRDIDQGIIPAKPGRAHGSVLMRSTYGLAFRLLKVSLIVWVIGMFSLGASYATVLGELDDFIANNEMYQQLILGPVGIELIEDMPPEQKVEFMRNAVSQAGFTITQLFASMVNNMMGMLAIVPLLMFILKAKSEEKDLRAELILAAPVCRKKYLAGFALIAFASAVVIQFTLALGLHSVAASVLDDPSELTFGFLLQANLVYIPALWVMIGFAILLTGVLPRATGAVWGYFAYSFMIIFFGRMDIFPEFLSYLTPIGFVPQLPLAPGETINILALIILTAVATVLTAAGFFFYSRRDINAVTH